MMAEMIVGCSLTKNIARNLGMTKRKLRMRKKKKRSKKRAMKNRNRVEQKDTRS